MKINILKILTSTCFVVSGFLAEAQGADDRSNLEKQEPIINHHRFLDHVENLINSQKVTPKFILNEIVKIVGETLRTDRCFLWVRQPTMSLSRGAFVWRKNETIPDLTPEQMSWSDDTWLPSQDPLYAAALNCKPSVYVNDVKTESSDIINSKFEDATFGHRSLIHAHIISDNELFGILQPCMFGEPRQWLQSEKNLIESLLPKISPVVKQFVLGDIIN